MLKNRVYDILVAPLAIALIRAIPIITDIIIKPKLKFYKYSNKNL